MTPETKTCPHCGEMVSISAKKCKHCKKWIEVEHQQNNTTRAITNKTKIDVNPLIKSTPFVFSIVGIMSLVQGFSVFPSAQSAIHEIYGALFLLVGVISLAIVPIYAQLECISKKIENMMEDKR